MTNFHYAVQVCDTKSNQNQVRYCTNDRTYLSKKSLVSLMDTINFCISINPNTYHVINFIIDDISQELNCFIDKIICYYSNNDKIKIFKTPVSFPGIMTSIKDCYEWLCKNGKQLVFQVQDDYLFHKTAIFEMADIWFQLYNDTKSDILVQPYNEYYHWTTLYRYRPTPRVIIPGKNRYWVQIYDISCSFMTSVQQLQTQWDLCEKFCNMDSLSKKLEAESLNYIMTRRGVLGLTPVQSLSLHMQSELEKDPYIDWKSWWDQVDIDFYK